MGKAPLSFILARVLITLSIAVGFFGLLDIELLSGAGLVFLAIQGFLVLTLICLFTERNLGRLLAVAVFTLSGLMAAAGAVAGSAFGVPVYLLVVDITIATVQLTLAWHLLVGAPAREYAAQEQSDVRT
jgi:hypothetical protein